MADNVSPIMGRIIDFSAAMVAGTGLSRGDDVRSRKFDERRKSGDFSLSGLASVAEGLMENISRLREHARMPYTLFNYGRRYQEVYTKFNAEPAKVSSDVLSEERIRHMQAIERTWKWITGNEPHLSTIGYLTYGNDVAGFAVAPEISEHADNCRVTQINAFCASLVIEAWALFESLSEDLWETALNYHPTILGTLKGSPRSRHKVRRNEAGRQGAAEPTLRVSFDDLQRNDFDVSSCIGTILKRKDNIGFRSIYDIRDSYHRAFSEQSNLIDEILDDSGLQYAAAVRNLLVHKRGIVDREFLDQVSGLSGIPQTDIGNQFPLSGTICAELADSCSACALWLVNAVHAWIIGHPERRVIRSADSGNCGESGAESSGPSPS